MRWLNSSTEAHDGYIAPRRAGHRLLWGNGRGENLMKWEIYSPWNIQPPLRELR
jgi:hypothetical protein